MAEYIDRAETMHIAFRSPFFSDSFVEKIKAIPAADVAPVWHGRWLCVDSDTEQFFLCNRCKKKEYWESNYCPYCGAKMDGGAD